jgi:hypothetical protein
MNGMLIRLGILIAAFAVSATAQTAVTTTAGGTAGIVPIFTTTSNVENSPITATSSGKVGIGTTAPTLPLVIAVPTGFNTGASIQYTDDGQAIANALILEKPSLLQIVGGPDGNSQAVLGIVQPQVQNGGISVLNFASSRASVAQINSGTFSPLQAGDELGAMAFGGDNGTNLRSIAAQIAVRATAAWSSTSFPAYLQFLTVPTGSTSGLERMRIMDSGNVGIGTTNPGATLEVNGMAKIDSTLQVSNSGIVFPSSSTPQTTPWTGVLCGGDYAEAVRAVGEKQTYEPGDVLVLTSDAKGDVQKSAEPYSTMVAGIYATKPGVIGRRQSLKNKSEELPMAMVGIVPTKVTAKNGAIHRGDLLVSSSVPGYAMKGTDRTRLVGAVIGKAMGSLDSGEGVIEVLVTLQ